MLSKKMSGPDKITLFLFCFIELNILHTINVTSPETTTRNFEFN